MNNLHGCTHGWESADGEPSECYDCLRERLTRERDDARARTYQAAIAFAKRLYSSSAFAHEMWRQRDEARRKAEDYSEGRPLPWTEYHA